MRLITHNSSFRRFKGPEPKATRPPALPPAQIPSEIPEAAMRAGEREGRRVRRRRGRAATRITRPELAFVPTPIAQAGLQTKLGGR